MTILRDFPSLLMFLCISSVGIAAQQLTLQPMTDSLIPNNSTENTTYWCTAESGSNTPLAWELNDLQIWSEEQKQEFTQDGVIMEKVGERQRIVITPQGRDKYNHLTVRCLTYTDQIGRIGIRLPPPPVIIISYGVPNEVDHLRLVYYNDSHLLLRWGVPLDHHPNISLFYTVTQHNIMTGTRELHEETSMTEVLIKQNGACERHNFSVTASNLAGTGPVSLITESIPLTPDVGEIDDSLKFDGVELSDSGGVNVSILFNEARLCNEHHPVLNYTAIIEGVGNVSASTVGLVRHLTNKDIPYLEQDKNYSVIIQACTKFSCKPTQSSLTIYTSHVLAATVRVYKMNVEVNCTLAGGSNVECYAQFTRFDKKTEILNTTQAGSTCPQLNETRGAYTDEIHVYAIVMGRHVLQPIMATILEEVSEDHFRCKVKTDDEPGGLSESEIVGIAFGCFFLPLVIAILVIIILIVKRRQRKEQGTQPSGILETQDGSDPDVKHRIPGEIQLREDGKYDFIPSNDEDKMLLENKSTKVYVIIPLSKAANVSSSQL